MKNLSLKLLTYLEDNNKIVPSRCQRNASCIIEKLLEESKKFKLFSLSKNFKSGVYLFGSVGAGKSVILKALNFIHPFSEMLHFTDLIFILQAKNHQHLNFFEKIKKKKVIVIDELYINNLTSLILFKKFIDDIRKIRIPIVISGNKKISKIYTDHVNPKLCEEIKEILNSELLSFNIKSKVDYRSNRKINTNFFLLKDLNHVSKQDLIVKEFAAFSSSREMSFNRKGNNFKLKKTYGNLVEIDFLEFFSKNLVFQDYELISKKMHFIVLRKTKQMTEDSKNLLSRFISFIDVLYDNKNILSIATNIDLKELYIGKTNYKEFKRTLSRLREMGSQVYIENNLNKRKK